jgi:hypothetical protein
MVMCTGLMIWSCLQASWYGHVYRPHDMVMSTGPNYGHVYRPHDMVMSTGLMIWSRVQALWYSHVYRPRLWSCVQAPKRDIKNWVRPACLHMTTTQAFWTNLCQFSFELQKHSPSFGLQRHSPSLQRHSPGVAAQPMRTRACVKK